MPKNKSKKMVHERQSPAEKIYSGRAKNPGQSAKVRPIPSGK
jgi:hypothetical protein